MARTFVLIVLSCSALSACEAGSISYDAPTDAAPAMSPPTAADSGHPPGPPAPPSDAVGGSHDASPLDGSAPNPAASSPPLALQDAGPAIAPDAIVSAPADGGVSKIARSAVTNSCKSWVARSNERCYGLWCGVSEQDIAAELRPGSKCSGLSAKMLCDGSVQMRMQMCAVRERSNLANLLESEEKIRMLIQACFYEEAALMAVPMSCLGCFLDSAECMARSCLTQCLASEGKSAACDQCRYDNNCFQPLPGCAELPSPF